MKAIVCVKQVPDTSGKVAVKENGQLDRASMMTITNPDDLNAIEAALQLKDQTGCEVVAISMGPPPAESMLRELLARGVDKAVLVSSREFGGSDTYATSQILAAAVRRVGVGPEDVVFCGRQAIDGDTAQVGPQIAEKLNLPQITYAADIKKEFLALEEAKKLGIPVIALIDTNVDPDLVTYKIPANDDAIRSVRLFSQVIANAAIEANGGVEANADQTAAPLDEEFEVTEEVVEEEVVTEE